MKLIIVAILILVLRTCHSPVNNIEAFRKVKNLESTITERTTFFHHLTLDSAALMNRVLTVYFTNTLDRVNPVITYQIVEYTLEPLKNQDKIDYDSLKVIFKMPRRPEGDIVLKLDKIVILNDWKLFDNKKYSDAVDTLMHISSVSEDSIFLESLNIDFARLTYGSNYERDAFFGLDTYKILYGALNECENRTRGDLSKLVDLQLSQFQNAEFNKRREMEKIFRPVLNCN